MKNLSDCRALLVDDAKANLQALAAPLKEQGHQISVATNGRLRTCLLLDRKRI